MQKPARHARPREQGSRCIGIETEKLEKTLWDPRQRGCWELTLVFVFKCARVRGSEDGDWVPEAPCCCASLQTLGRVNTATSLLLRHAEDAPTTGLLYMLFVLHIPAWLAPLLSQSLFQALFEEASVGCLLPPSISMSLHTGVHL